MKKIFNKIRQLHWKISSIRQQNRNITKTQQTNKNSTIPSTQSEEIRVSISALSVAKATIMIILLIALREFIIDIQDILLIFFISFLFAAALDPLVDKLQKKHIPRWLSVLGIYFLIFTLLATLISNIIPLVASQTQELAKNINTLIPEITNNESSNPIIKNLQNYIKQLYKTVDINTLTKDISTSLNLFSEQLLSIAGNTWEAIKIISNGLINTAFVLVLTFFMVIEEKNIENFFLSLFPSKHSKYISERINTIKTKVGYWLRGQFILSITIGTLTYIGLLILGVEYAATLAMVAMVTELIPYAGPLIAWGIALPIAGNQSLWMVLAITILYFVIQEVENNFLVPIVMKKTVGLNPIIVIFSMLVGAHHLGIIGLILAIPVTTCLGIFVQDYIQKTNNQKGE